MTCYLFIKLQFLTNKTLWISYKHFPFKLIFGGNGFQFCFKNHLEVIQYFESANFVFWFKSMLTFLLIFLCMRFVEGYRNTEVFNPFAVNVSINYLSQTDQLWTTASVVWWLTFVEFCLYYELFKRQSHETVKHTQTIPISRRWSLLIPLKVLENLSFLMFSGGIERDQWQEMG